MPKMNQPGTDYGTRGETGEKEPKGAAKADLSGERKEGKINGVGMGKADATGERNAGSKETGEYNTGRSESVCYNHVRLHYETEDHTEGQKK